MSEISAPSRQLQSALDWAAKGFPVFPLRRGSKKPAIADWPALASRDEARIRAWWAKEPNYNIGVLTNDMIVVDIDNKNGKRGSASLLKLIDLDEMETLTVGTDLPPEKWTGLGRSTLHLGGADIAQG